MAAENKPARRRGRPPRGATQLSRSAIVDAALEVIAGEGIDAVSVRAVARVLAVDPKSLYNHVDGKDGLLDAVAEHLLGAIVLPTPTGDTRVDLRAIADAFRAAALVRPEASVLILTRQLASFEGLAPVQSILQVLRDAGASSEEAVHIMRTLVAALVGMLLREVSAGTTYGTSDPGEIAARRRTLEQSGLSAVVEAAADLSRFDATVEYDYGIGLATDAVLSRLRSSA